MEKQQIFDIWKENTEWFRKNYERFKRKYDNKWILIRNKKIVAAESNLSRIMEIAKRYDPNEIMVEYVQSKKIAMFF